MLPEDIRFGTAGTVLSMVCRPSIRKWGLAVLTVGATAISAAAVPAYPQSPASSGEAAPLDLTGYWVSLISDDWRYRMIRPPQGDYMGIPLNDEGLRVADQWDPSTETGRECKVYGAAAIMRLPVRLNVRWDDDESLRMDIDAGLQTRLFRFGQAPPADGTSWQGDSAAEWQFASGGTDTSRGQLKVVTNRMRPGYLRPNGVPYSENAVLTEYFNRIVEAGGEDYLIVTAIVDDPQYLSDRWVRTMYFRREPDDSGWNPAPCSAP